ncbi:MAG: tRNA pseudouridine(38-40) synthase TruA [Verrucomicrobiales bacterium]|nr:tRNA pseudouridine(38-40) synthase TruA [Verrucomicrobiales bacterium]
MGSLKLKLTIAYHGARYKGWQVQKSGITVQQKVEEALKRFFPSVDRVHSSSRTDTGVHARGMVAHVEVQKDEFRIGELKLRLALNAFLPDDVSVTEVKRVPGNFHARFDATGKQYRYMIWNHPALNPLQREVSWHVPRELDFLRMQEGAKFFIGNHDFRAFAVKREYEMRSTIRVVSNCKLYKKDSMLTCLIEGEGFLYKMCRGIVGTLVEVGLGKLKPVDIRNILKSCDRSQAGMTAPAHGLILWKVMYGKKKAK